VLPEPVGATTRAWSPARTASHAPVCAAVGAAKAPANHARVGPEKPVSPSAVMGSLCRQGPTRTPRPGGGAREADGVAPWCGEALGVPPGAGGDVRLGLRTDAGGRARPASTRQPDARPGTRRRCPAAGGLGRRVRRDGARRAGALAAPRHPRPTAPLTGWTGDDTHRVSSRVEQPFGLLWSPGKDGPWVSTAAGGSGPDVGGRA